MLSWVHCHNSQVAPTHRHLFSETHFEIITYIMTDTFCSNTDQKPLNQNVFSLNCTLSINMVHHRSCTEYGSLQLFRTLHLLVFNAEVHQGTKAHSLCSEKYLKL